MNPEKVTSFFYDFRAIMLQEPSCGWKQFQFPSYEVMQRKIEKFLIQQQREQREIAQEFLRVVSGLMLDSPFTVFQWYRASTYCLSGESGNQGEIFNDAQFFQRILKPITPPNFVLQTKSILLAVRGLEESSYRLRALSLPIK